MSFPVAIILFLIIAGFLVVRILQWDPEVMWQRREQRYRKLGLATQRPEDWEKTAARSKAVMIGFLVVFGLWFVWTATR